MFVDEKRNGELVVDLSHASAEGLSHLLRNLPDDFAWDYKDCYHCGMGLTTKTWAPDRLPYVSTMTELLGIPKEVGEKIFVARYGEEHSEYGYLRSLTSFEVADMIDAWVAAKRPADMDI
jgi:hypothetical protein